MTLGLVPACAGMTLFRRALPCSLLSAPLRLRRLAGLCFLLSAFRLLVLLLRPRLIGFVGGDGAGEAGVGIRVQLRALLTGVVDGVAQRLGGLVGELAGTEGIQAIAPLVDRLLRDLAGTIQLLFEL